MRIVLAPMDGVLDHMMRNILTDIGDYDLCVTEFIRIVDQLLPDKVFHRNCPELKSEGNDYYYTTNKSSNIICLIPLGKI